MLYKDRNDPRQRAAARKYYQAHKGEYLACNRAKKAAIREWLIEQKAKPCMDCGVRYPEMSGGNVEEETGIYETDCLFPQMAPPVGLEPTAC